MIPICFESFMESDNSLRGMFVERQSEKDLLRYAFTNKFRYVSESEFFVVIRMPHEAASLSAPIFQP